MVLYHVLVETSFLREYASEILFIPYERKCVLAKHQFFLPVSRTCESYAVINYYPDRNTDR